MELTLAEELVLVSRKKGSGRFVAGEAVSFGVAGALLTELALDGRIEVRDKRIVAVDGGSGGLAARHVGPQAEELWKRIRGQDRLRRPARWVAGAKNDKAYQKARTELRDRGIVQDERRRVLGVFPATRWTEVDPGPGFEIRDRVVRAMNGGDADERTVALVLLVGVSELGPRVFPPADRRTRKDRLHKFTAGPWASEPVGETVQAVLRGVTAALSASRAAAAAD